MRFVFAVAFLVLLSFHRLVDCDYCNDFDAISVKISPSGANSIQLRARYSEVSRLLSEGLTFGGQLSDEDKSRIQTAVLEQLQLLKLDNHSPAMLLSHNSADILRNTLQELRTLDCNDLQQESDFYSSRQQLAESRNQSLCMFKQGILVEQGPEANSRLRPSAMLPQLDGVDMPSITVYQTPNAFTGGTTAMRTLHQALHELGFRSTLCNATNMASVECSEPSNNTIAITGEWCDPVISEYLRQSNTSAFYGRGVQYYLGFHHGRDSCRGWIAAADSHFIHSTLLHRGLSAYFLGCVMSEHIEHAYLDVVRRYHQHTHSNSNCEYIPKEKLVLVDADWFDDYSPRIPVGFNLPEGYQYVVLRGFSPDAVRSLLQRAAIVIDLALPGPERISSEAILFGAIPIVAERWNGASEVDFPELLRVDALNGTAITEAVQYVADNYNSLLEHRLTHFHAYVVSMWIRARNTANAFFSSAGVQFVIDTTAPTSDITRLQRETLALFQVLALIHLHPLALIDIIVADVLWFTRHHYVFVDYLRQAGYLRADVMDPREFVLHSQEHHLSLVRITHHPAEELGVERPWSAFKVVLPVGQMFDRPEHVYQLLHMVRYKDDVRGCMLQHDLPILLGGPHVAVNDVLSAGQHTGGFPTCAVSWSTLEVRTLLRQSIDDVQSGGMVGTVRRTVFWMAMKEVFVDQLVLLGL